MIGVALSRVADRRLMNYGVLSVPDQLIVPWPWPRSQWLVSVSRARESASATGLAPPLTCLMSAVNWEMKSR